MDLHDTSSPCRALMPPAQMLGRPSLPRSLTVTDRPLYSRCGRGARALSRQGYQGPRLCRHACAGTPVWTRLRRHLSTAHGSFSTGEWLDQSTLQAICSLPWAGLASMAASPGLAPASFLSTISLFWVPLC